MKPENQAMLNAMKNWKRQLLAGVTPADDRLRAYLRGQLSDADAATLRVELTRSFAGMNRLEEIAAEQTHVKSGSGIAIFFRLNRIDRLIHAPKEQMVAAAAAATGQDTEIFRSEEIQDGDVNAMVHITPESELHVLVTQNRRPVQKAKIALFLHGPEEHRRITASATNAHGRANLGRMEFLKKPELGWSYMISVIKGPDGDTVC